MTSIGRFYGRLQSELYNKAINGLHTLADSPVIPTGTVAPYDTQGYGGDILNPPPHGSTYHSSSSSSYIAIDGQSASSSWCRAHFEADGQSLNFFE
jgi:hypothetical protein